MMRRIASLAMVLLSVQALAVPGRAVAGPVKVALTDMSSAATGQDGAGGSRPDMAEHGTMAVRIDRDRIKAGPVHFEVMNRSRDMSHEMLVIAVKHPHSPLPYNAAQARVAEDRVKRLADTEALKPGTSRALDVTLRPGSYLLICNVPGHYAAGMAAPLTVVP